VWVTEDKVSWLGFTDNCPVHLPQSVTVNRKISDQISLLRQNFFLTFCWSLTQQLIYYLAADADWWDLTAGWVFWNDEDILILKKYLRFIEKSDVNTVFTCRGGVFAASGLCATS
jgi:hypothetical protein